MEQRILSYLKNSEVSEIVSLLGKKHFLLVEHDSSAKQLTFKKAPKLPTTKILCEP
jgi:hypothetical protein